MENETLAIVISRTRNIKNISQRELARLTGIDNAEISRIEKGKRKKPGVLVLKSLSEALNIDLKFLMKLAEYTDDEIETFTKIKWVKDMSKSMTWGPIIKYSKEFEKERRIDLLEVMRGFKKGDISEYEFLELLSLAFNTDFFDFIFEEKRNTISDKKDNIE